MAFLAPLAVSAVGALISKGIQGNGQQAANPNLQMPVNQQQVNDQYNSSTGALNQQQQFVNALQAQNGIGNQSISFQNAQNQANGVGPNPAQAQLAQATSANTANQAALMAGQRGASSNAGLIARQAAMQGGANQQNAVGQAATLQAQQQLAGQQQMANIAQQQVQQQAQGLQNQNAFSQQLYGQTLNGISGQNAAANQAAGQSNAVGMNNTNNQFKQNNALAGGVGTALTSMFGSNDSNKSPGVGQPGGMSGNDYYTKYANGNTNNNEAYGGMINNYANGGAINGPRSKTAQYFMNMQQGGNVPGQAQVNGDSKKNDTVPAMLSPGEIVIPRHIVQGANPSADAAKFVAAILAKKGMK